jgi:hypothetical protein
MDKNFKNKKIRNMLENAFRAASGKQEVTGSNPVSPTV